MQGRYRIPRVKPNGSSGLSLLSVIVAISLLSATTLLVLSSTHQQTALAKKTELHHILNFVKSFIYDQTSCTETRRQFGDCSSGRLIALYSHTRDGKPVELISDRDPGTKIGPLTLRAECGKDDSVVVRAVMLAESGNLATTSSADFLTDPVTGQKLTWVDRKSLLFPEDLPLCAPSLTADMEQTETFVFDPPASCGSVTKYQPLTKYVGCLYSGQRRTNSWSDNNSGCFVNRDLASNQWVFEIRGCLGKEQCIFECFPAQQ